MFLPRAFANYASWRSECIQIDTIPEGRQNCDDESLTSRNARQIYQSGTIAFFSLFWLGWIYRADRYTQRPNTETTPVQRTASKRNLPATFLLCDVIFFRPNAAPVAVLYARLDEGLILISCNAAYRRASENDRIAGWCQRMEQLLRGNCTAAKTPVLLLTSETEVGAMQFLGKQRFMVFVKKFHPGCATLSGVTPLLSAEVCQLDAKYPLPYVKMLRRCLE